MILYATVDDLNDWLPATVSVPDDAESQLRAAAFRVALACNRNPYTDQPAIGEVDGLRDATCAQVEAWMTAGVRPAAGGLTEAPVSRSSILDGTVQRDTAVLAAAAERAARELAPAASDILTAAGLLWQPIPVGDNSGAMRQWGLPVPESPWGGYAPDWARLWP